MGLFEHFPYANFHELNLDIICQKIRELNKRMDDLPDDIKEQIEPVIVEWIQQYLTDAGIYVDNATLKIVASDPSTPGGSVSAIQVGNKTYQILDNAALQGLTDLGDVVNDQGIALAAAEADIQDIEDRMPVGTVNTFRDCRFYINAVTGDDDDTGLDPAHAFRTLDRAFEEFSKYGSLWLYLYGANADYEVTKHGVFAGHTLHITSEVAGCRIVFRDPDWQGSGGIPIYNSHWNLQARNSSEPLYIKCYEGQTSTDSHLYFDNTLLTTSNVIFEDYIAFYGASLDCQNSSLVRMNCQNSEIKIYGGMNITNKDPANYAMRFENCLVHLTGAFTTDSLTAAGAQAAYLFRGSMAFVGSIVLSNQVLNYLRPIDADQGSRITISTARLNTIDGYCANPSITAQGSEIITY